MKLSFTKKTIIFFLVIFCIPISNCFSDSDKANKRIVYKMYREYQKNFMEVDEISPEYAMKEFNSGDVLFVDARTEAEMSVSTLPKAISKEEFLDNKNLYKNKKIVSYCTIGYRSGLFAQKMKKSNIKVYNLSAGILGWTHGGGKVYDSRGIVQRIHVYGKDWDYAPNGFDTITFGLLDKFFQFATFFLP